MPPLPASPDNNPPIPATRTGQAPPEIDRAAFHARFTARFADPAFAPEQQAIERLETIAWQAMKDGRKAPVTQPAGAGFADPAYDLSVDWIAAHRSLQQAQQRWADAATPSRVLVVCGSSRNDGTCPGENAKSWRLAQLVEQTLEAEGLQADMLDLSLVTSEWGRTIHPCKGCASTAMPLCHWPCSCYPNHALGQVNDWMNEIYERWVSAHGIVIVAPTYWYQSPSLLKLMIDRLVCADGGNPDPSSTHGKKVLEAKQLEKDGWDYPKHVAGRVYGLVVHGDVAGVEVHRRNLSDWLDWMGLIDAGTASRLDRYIGYFEPYYNSHATLDADEPVQQETRNVALAVAAAVAQLRAGTLSKPDARLKPPRPK